MLTSTKVKAANSSANFIGEREREHPFALSSKFFVHYMCAWMSVVHLFSPKCENFAGSKHSLLLFCLGCNNYCHKAFPAPLNKIIALNFIQVCCNPQPRKLPTSLSEVTITTYGHSTLANQAQNSTLKMTALN